MRFGLTAALAVSSLACDGGTTEPTIDPLSIRFDPCETGVLYPDWVAYQNGSGGWSAAMHTDGAWRFTLTHARVAVAIHTPALGLVIAHGSSDELRQYLASCSTTPRTISGFLKGFTAEDDLSVFMGQRSAFPNSNSAGVESQFFFDDVNPFAEVVVAVRSRSIVTSTTGQTVPQKLFIQRGFTGDDLGVLDFNSISSGNMEMRTVTVTNRAPGETLEVFGSFVTPDNLWTPDASVLGHLETEARLSYYVTSEAGATAPFYPVSRARTVPGEEPVLTILGGRADGSLQERRFSVTLYSGSQPADVSASFGPALGGVTVTGGPHPAASYAIQAEYDKLWSLRLNGGAAEVIVTRGYIGTEASEVTIAVPDLTGVPGFQAGWIAPPGFNPNWRFTATNASLNVYNGRVQNYHGAWRAGTELPPP